MRTAPNDIFRFVSVRGPEPVHQVEPAADIVDLDVVRILAATKVDLRRPDPKIARLLAPIGVLGVSALNALALARLGTRIKASNVETLEELRGLAWKLPDGTNAPRIEQFGSSDRFLAEYRAVANSWLTLLLTSRPSNVTRRHEDLIRAAHIAHCVVHNPGLLAGPNALLRLRTANVAPPSTWLPAGRLAARLTERHGAQLPALAKTVAPSARALAITRAKVEHAELVARRETVERILAKSQATYADWKVARQAATPSQPRGRVRPPLRLPPWFRRQQEAVRPRNRVSQPLLRLDANFFTELGKKLTPAERRLYTTLRLGLPEPLTHAEHDAGLAWGQWMDDANKLCHLIYLWEDEETRKLPDRQSKTPSNERPLVRAIGWGDLIVAREHLIGYAAQEISHIENVMPGETKLREHERQRTVEQVVETETLNETESERDLETTDRYELQSEARTTIEQEYSIEAGLNTSGKYGLTQVDTSLKVGMTQNKNEARSSAQTLAHDVVSKAVERTFERVRELRRQTITEQIRELNRHGLANASTGAGGAQPTDVSGIYLWVEKLLEVELRHYGTRMLVEFYIPEPAVSLLARGLDAGNRPRKPASFDLAPTDILPENYMCLTSAYGAQDVEPPPAPYIQVGYSWSTTPNEESDRYGQDARADNIAVPRGYQPVAVTALVSAHPGPVENTDVFMAIGGEVVVDVTGVDYGESGQAPEDNPNEGGPFEVDFDPALSWPAGVPVVVRAVGHYDNTLVAEAALRCVRTPEAMAAWQLQTWGQLRAGHEAMMQEYRNQLDRLAVEEFGEPPVERPDAENRRIEAEELRKWAIKSMRLEPFNFDAIVSEDDGAQEVDPLSGDLLATVARFFEEAFEWPQASYFLYPYYWARRDTWSMRSAVGAVDARHAAFLRAGAARFVVPITPGYEERVVRYLEADGNELSRLGPTPNGYSPADSTLTNIWLELLLDRRPELALGSGTLRVAQNQNRVTINPDSNWRASTTDLGRELYIAGDVYRVTKVDPFIQGVLQQLTIDENFKRANDPAAVYATGSVPYGPPWVERVPTSLLILEGSRPNLTSLTI